MTFQCSYIFHRVLLFHRLWTNVKIGFVKKRFNLHSHSVRCDVLLACKGFCCWWVSQRPLRTVLEHIQRYSFSAEATGKMLGCFGRGAGWNEHVESFLLWPAPDTTNTFLIWERGLLCRQLMSTHLQNWYWWQRGHCVRKDYLGPSMNWYCGTLQNILCPKTCVMAILYRACENKLLSKG